MRYHGMIILGISHYDYNVSQVTYKDWWGKKLKETILVLVRHKKHYKRFVMDICITPGLIVGAMCCVKFCSVKEKNNRVVDYDDERPRKMTPYEYQMYCAHMNAYGGHNNK